MISGVGVDLLEIDRIEKMLLKKHGLERIFTQNELQFAKDNAATLAGNFAVKEAVSKVFGTGFFGMEPVEIEVLRDEKGCPYVNLLGKAKNLACQKRITKIHVSITNTKEFVQAFAVGESL